VFVKISQSIKNGTIMTKYWLIALPGLEMKEEGWRRLNEKTTIENDYSINYKLDVPELKVGTLDTLMSASELLLKLDQNCEGLVHRLVQHLSVLLEKTMDELYAKLLVNGVALENFIPLFQWDEAKYPSRQSIKELHDSIERQISQIDNELKSKMNAYSIVKGQLTALERKQTGNLLVRNLSDVVRKEDLLLDSEYLQTLLVAVPK
jgi:V-type H+-transporting ATPase subunit C